MASTDPPELSHPATGTSVTPSAFQYWKVALIIILIWAGIASYITVLAPLRERVSLRFQMGCLADEYFRFQARHQRSPMDLDELLAFRDEPTQSPSAASGGDLETVVKAIRHGDLIVHWNASVDAPNRSRHQILAYEAEVPANQGLVIRGSGTVSKITGWEYRSLSPVTSIPLPPGFPRVGQSPSGKRQSSR